MNTLIVYTHPNHKSLSYSLYESILHSLIEKEEQVQTIDLYAENFNPVLVYNEDIRRRDMHLDPELTAYREKIKWADRLVFVYPIFWGRPPAMLLGFIDRIFASNFAYKDTGKTFPEPLLKGKEAVCISVMKGPTGYLQYWLGNVHQILMKKALLSYVGFKKVKFFEFGDMEKKDGKQGRAIEKVGRYFAS